MKATLPHAVTLPFTFPVSKTGPPVPYPKQRIELGTAILGSTLRNLFSLGDARDARRSGQRRLIDMNVIVERSKIFLLEEVCRGSSAMEGV